MYNIKLALIFLIYLSLISGCNKNIHTAEDNIVFLNKETIQDLENGIIRGTPLRLDRPITLKDVEQVWGKPIETYDHEDIQTYMFKVKNKRVIIDEDELKNLYIFQIEMKISREEIFNKMGEPTDGKKTGKTLVYEKENYHIAFRKMDETTWSLIIFAT